MADIGFYGEYFVMEYLRKKLDCDVFIPLRRVKGLDFVIKTPDASYYDIEVKAGNVQGDNKDGQYYFFYVPWEFPTWKNLYYILYCHVPEGKPIGGRKRVLFVFRSKELFSIVKALKGNFIGNRKAQRVLPVWFDDDYWVISNYADEEKPIIISENLNKLDYFQ